MRKYLITAAALLCNVVVAHADCTAAKFVCEAQANLAQVDAQAQTQKELAGDLHCPYGKLICDAQAVLAQQQPEEFIEIPMIQKYEIGTTYTVTMPTHVFTKDDGWAEFFNSGFRIARVNCEADRGDQFVVINADAAQIGLPQYRSMAIQIVKVEFVSGHKGCVGYVTKDAVNGGNRFFPKTH